MTLNRLLPLAGAALLLSTLLATAQTPPPPPFMPGAPPANNAILPAPPIPAVRSYTVVKGDSLWKIAKDYYGKGHAWKIIANANPGLKTHGLKVGSSIVIP